MRVARSTARPPISPRATLSASWLASTCLIGISLKLISARSASIFAASERSLATPALLNPIMRHSLRTGREELTVLRFGILGGDSLFLALLTMGEGYHNYHHEFQHDYRNGVKPWQFDPTKWLIWTLSKLRLVRNLRRVPADKIESAQAQTRNASC